MKRVLRWTAVGLGALVAIAVVAYGVVYVVSERTLARAYPFAPIAITVPSDAEAIAEGGRLARVQLCLSCHGDNGEGRLLFEQLLIAHIVAPNLTTAAARYSDSELVGIVRSGVRPDGRSMVVMPSSVMRLLSDADLGKIIAFLRSLPAAKGPGPDVGIGPLGRIGLLQGLYKIEAQLVAEAVLPPDAVGEAAARGRYLASTICSHCHGTDLRGAPPLAGDAGTPPLLIVAAYSPEAFTRLLREGVALGDRELGEMREVARGALHALTDAEIADLYVYLHELAPAPGPKS